MNEPKQLPVAELKPAAARLWGALLTQRPGETYISIVQRSGIREYLTFVTAREQLIRLGFIVIRDGRDCPVMQPEPATERVTIPYPGTITKITTAKQ